MKKTEQELKEYAKLLSNTIVIRSYEDGSSKDERRKTTKPEKKIIESIIFGGLLAIRNGVDIQSTKDTCEYIGKLQIPEMNGYDSVYIPISEFQF